MLHDLFFHKFGLNIYILEISPGFLFKNLLHIYDLEMDEGLRVIERYVGGVGLGDPEPNPRHR